jgi:hypothetical protein
MGSTGMNTQGRLKLKGQIPVRIGKKIILQQILQKLGMEWIRLAWAGIHAMLGNFNMEMFQTL